MFQIILFIHLVLCLGLIGLVLMQQGKGAEMGAALGGGSSSMFGAAGPGSFVTRLTTGLAIGFMVTSVLLVRAYDSVPRVASENVDPLKGSVMEGAATSPAQEEAAPAAAPVENKAAPATAPVAKENSVAKEEAKAEVAPAAKEGEKAASAKPVAAAPAKKAAPTKK